MTTSGMAARTNRTSGLLLDEALQVVAVRARRHRLREPYDVRGVDVAEPECDLLETGDHEPLPIFDGLNAIGRLHQRFVGAGIEPRDPPAKPLDRQLAAIEIIPIHVRDLELSAPRRRQRCGDV